MKFIAETEGKKHDLELKREGGRVTANVDGRVYDLEVSEPEQGVFLFKLDGKVFETSASRQTNAADPYMVRIGSDVHEIQIIDPKRLRGAKSDDTDASGKAEIKTAMPGKVVRILVSVGDTVQKGDGVIVVEAMKMQNEMKAPKDGSIAEIRFSENDTVSAGNVLVVIE